MLNKPIGYAVSWWPNGQVVPLPLEVWRYMRVRNLVAPTYRHTFRFNTFPQFTY